MTISRDEFLAALQDQARGKPAIAARMAVGDPAISASMGAMATMLAMLSSQIDLVAGEVFTKARDTTVLADAAMKGILPFARPARLSLLVKNASAMPLQIAVGRLLLDHMARIYVTDEAANIAPNSSTTIRLRQKTVRQVTHTVVETQPFYRVKIPPSPDSEALISGLSIKLDDVVQPFTPEFANLTANAPGYALEVDENQTLWAVFGWRDVFGVQPNNGSTIALLIEETAGLVDFPDGVNFSFEFTSSQAEAAAKITLASVIYAGAGYVDIATLRDWARYQSTHDASAVYLGDFDALIRRNLPQLGFLSVWNEQLEENVRGPSFNNVNRLFIACSMAGVDNAWLRNEITRIVIAADDSYRLTFIDPVDTAVVLNIQAQVAAVHDVADVRAKIQAVVLSLYGINADTTKRGMLAISVKRLHEALAAQVAALQGDSSDFHIQVPAQASNLLPEQRRYVSAQSLTIDITQATYNDGQWSH